MAELPFVTFLSSLTSLSTELIERLDVLLKHEQYQTHQVFHGAGQIESRLWFLQQGLVRAYYFDRSGKEHTIHFFSENNIIFSWEAIFHRPAELYLEALEASYLYSLSYSSFHELYRRYPEVKAITEIVARQRLEQDRFYSRLMTWTADERYRQFRKVDPAIFRKVPVRLIATYLNMTRENLSKLITADVR